MSLKIVVLAKQVPDTRCVGKDAIERHSSGVYRDHADHGTRTCRRDYP